MTDKDELRIRRQFDLLSSKLPGFGQRALARLRRPGARLIRIPVGVLLMFGGIFSILPFLGLWMLPLGLMLLAIDVPLLRRPVGSSLEWVERKWARFRHRPPPV